jgi:hypothetical protein
MHSMKYSDLLSIEAYTKENSSLARERARPHDFSFVPGF